MGELIASGLASTLLGLVSVQVRQYQFWRAWIANLFWGGFGLYLMLNAIMGVLAVSLAHALDWTPVEHSEVWSGLLIAAVLQGAIRVELPRVLSEDLEGGGSLLRRLAVFLFDLLNEEAVAAIQARLDGLDDEQLIALALYLHSRYVEPDIQMPESARRVLLQGITEAAEKLDKHPGNPAGRGTLEHFCINQFATRRLKPVARLGKADDHKVREAVP